MSNVLDYVRGCNKPFSEEPLCRVDSLVLSWLAYTRIPEDVERARTDGGIALAQITAQTHPLLLVAHMGSPRQSEELLSACAQSPRFSGVRACRAVDEGSRASQTQFSATTFLLPDVGAYLAFRGTDDSLVGWKENFNMAFMPAVPAQAAARDYLERAAEQLACPLWAGGHSKGGNLAVFAAMTCDDATRARIRRCYTHDGPGFTAATCSSHGWAGAWDLVDRTVPEESLVGLLLGGQNDCETTVVRSTNPGLLQHDPFSWVVEGRDFSTVRGITYDAYRTGKRINAWLAAMPLDEREQFVDVLYRLVEATGETTFSGLVGSLGDGSLNLALRRLEGLPAEDRALFMEKLEDLAATLLLGPAPTNPQTSVERADAAVEKVDDAAARFNDRLSKLDRWLG